VFGGVIPGPGHPKYIDSFLFPGLAYVSAIQKEGLCIYDSYHRKMFTSFLFLFLALADAICMVELSSSVGHHGRKVAGYSATLLGKINQMGPTITRFSSNLMELTDCLVIIQTSTS
jgi:hypothetical protein